MKTAETVAPNRRLHMHARFYFLRIYSLLYAKKIQESDNQKFKVLRTQTFSHVGDVKFKKRANKVQIK